MKYRNKGHRAEKRAGTPFYREVGEELCSFLSYMKKNRAGALLSGAAALLFYGAWAVSRDITIDSEIMMTDPESMMDSWLGINRFGLVFTKHLFGMTTFSPFVSRILAIAFLWTAAMLFAFCVFEWSGRQRRFRLFGVVFPVLYLTSPCFAEQFYFVLQSAEAAFALLLCGLGVYGAGQYALFGKRRLWAILSVPVLVWAFGTYQAMVPVTVSLILILFISAYLRETGAMQDKTRWGWLLGGIRLCSVFLASLTVYLIAAFAVRTLAGESQAYVAEMMHWKTDGIRQCISCIKGEIRRVVDSYYVMFRPSFQYLAALFLAGASALGFTKKRRGFLYFLAAVILLVFSPFFMTVLTGYYQPVRAQLSYPLVYAFCGAFLTVLASSGREGEEDRREGRWRAGKVLALASVLFCLFSAWNQGLDTAGLFQTIRQVSDQDTALTRDIYKEAEKLALREGKRIEDCTFIFTGKRETVLPEGALRGDVIGCSFYQWDADSPMGISRRIYDLMQAMGLPAGEPELSRYLDALPVSETMVCYPADGSVRIEGDTVIVKLSEPD